MKLILLICLDLFYEWFAFSVPRKKGIKRKNEESQSEYLHLMGSSIYSAYITVSNIQLQTLSFIPLIECKSILHNEINTGRSYGSKG